MSHLTETTDRVVNKIEKECGLTNGAFLFLIALLFINTSEWKINRTKLAQFYQILEIIEKDEELKNEFNQNQAFAAINNLQSESSQEGNAGERDRDAATTGKQN